MNIKDALIFGKKYLNEKNIQDSGLKCKIALAKALEVSKEYLIMHDLKELNEKEESKYKEFLVRLSNNEPIQYITNYQEFMKLGFYVDKNVLIPQPDTEILVQKVIDKAKEYSNAKILDMCTGSGAIAVSLKKYLENSEIYAVDISSDALKVAEKNAKENDVKINFIQSNLFDELYEYNFDIIVSNPPYIETDVIETLDEEVKKEPILALNGGIDGLEFYKKIAFKAKKYLKKDGILALEIGYDQYEKVKAILELESYKNIICFKDLSGNDRVIFASL